MLGIINGIPVKTVNYSLKIEAGVVENSMAAEALFALTEFNRSQCPKMRVNPSLCFRIHPPLRRPKRRV